MADRKRATGRVVLVLVAGAVVAVVGLLLFGQTDRVDDASTIGGDWAQLVLTTLGLLVALGGVVAAIRNRRAWSWQAWSPLKPLGRAERRSVQRQVQGREPVDPSRMLVLRAVAGAQRAQWPFVVVFCGATLVNTGVLVNDHSTLWISLMGGALACMVVGVSLTAWQAVVATRFLREHPEPEAHSTEP